MASDKPAEGVALSINPPDRYDAGVPVTVTEDVSAAESKSGQKATPMKEKS